MASLDLSNYSERFDPEEFLKQYYMAPGSPQSSHDFGVRSIHDVLSKWSPETENVRVLDYGCGPVICNIISVAGRPEVSEIVLAEYTPRNREAIQKWLDKDPSAFDWSPYFTYVVKTLEGKTDQEVAEREERLRSLVKLVSCDLTADHPIEKGYGDPYDVVISFLCLETCSSNVDEYHANVKRLASLTKPGGNLLLVSTERNPPGELGYYTVGSQRFVDLNVSYDHIASALKEARITVLSVDRYEVVRDKTKSNCLNFMFIHAGKNY